MRSPNNSLGKAQVLFTHMTHKPSAKGRVERKDREVLITSFLPAIRVTFALLLLLTPLLALLRASPVPLPIPDAYHEMFACCLKAGL